MLTPNHKEITKPINDTDKQYKCQSCRKTFTSEEMQFEDMPDNFHVVGLEDNQKMEKCPYCGYLAFFDFINVGGES